MAADNLNRRTSDEIEIRSIIARLAMLADDGDLDEYAMLFTEDGHWEMISSPNGPQFAPLHGREVIRKAAKERRAVGTVGPGTHSYHAVPTSAVKVDGDTATARSYMLYYKNADTKPEVALFKVYRDTFKRTADGWKLHIRYIDPA